MNAIWKNAIESAGLILALGISFHTIYNIIRTQVIKRRQFRMLIEKMRLEFDLQLELISVIAGKSDEFRDKHMPQPIQPILPQLTKTPRDALAFIITRVEQVLSSHPDVDFSVWADSLNKKQLGKLMEFLKAYQFYCRRLDIRLDEHKAAPDRSDALDLFLTSAAMPDDDLPQKFSSFKKSLE